MSNCVHNERSVYGLSWFCSPKPALLWLGVSDRQYPQSFELWPLCKLYADADYLLEEEGRKVMEHFSLNEHYYKLDTDLKWSKL